MNGTPAIDSGPPAGLPFCSGAGLLVLVLLSIVLALLVTLSGLSQAADFWFALGLHGLFILWITLSCAAILCLIQRRLARFPSRRHALAGFALVQVVVLAFSWLVTCLEPWLTSLELLAHSDPFLFIGRNLGISLLASLLLLRYLILQQRWREQVAAESRARLLSLQARIRPHFLFNTLNTIAGLIRDQPEQAEQAILDLSDLLRSGLRGEVQHSLAMELELIRGYLRLEALRLGPRLQVDWRLDERLPGRQRIPALLIQPLVENAIAHGIARRPDGGTLTIEARPVGRRLEFVIANPLPPKDAERDSRPHTQCRDDSQNNRRAHRSGNRVALENIRQRLELGYAEGARLKLTASEGRFQARLTLPLEAVHPDKRDPAGR